MGKTLKFYGSSDDCFCYDVNDKSGDEISAYDSPAAFKLLDEATGEFLFIVGVYAKSPAAGVESHCWDIWPKFGLTEDEPSIGVPAWLIEFVKEHDYSTGLKITVPDTVVVQTWQEPEGASWAWAK